MSARCPLVDQYGQRVLAGLLPTAIIMVISSQLEISGMLALLNEHRCKSVPLPCGIKSQPHDARQTYDIQISLIPLGVSCRILLDDAKLVSKYEVDNSDGSAKSMLRPSELARPLTRTAISNTANFDFGCRDTHTQHSR